MDELNAIDILMVEDNPRDAELAIRALRKQNLANRLFVVEDGVKALDFLFCRGEYAGREMLRPKVVLLDLKLPKINGLEVLAEIKKDERMRCIPVVVVSSSEEDPDIRRAFDLGANSYVIKPVDFNAFMQAMTQIGMYWLVVNRNP